MVTNAEKPAPEPTRSARLREQVEAALRIVIAGSSVGAVRRIVLYLVAIISMATLALLAGGLAAVVVEVAGMIALMLLIGTDDLR